MKNVQRLSTTVFRCGVCPLKSGSSGKGGKSSLQLSQLFMDWETLLTQWTFGSIVDIRRKGIPGENTTQPGMKCILNIISVRSVSFLSDR